MYRFTVLSKALKNVVQNNLMITDEASSIEYLGLESVLVEASKSNQHQEYFDLLLNRAHW
jgi:2-C-methyl-D-erythritol 4-phosphate cytidylyltransferase